MPLKRRNRVPKHKDQVTGGLARMSRLPTVVLVASFLAASCGDDGGGTGIDPTPNEPNAFELSSLDGVWMSEASFLDAAELDPSFERLAELNPGHSATSAREFWREFRATDWAILEIAAPVVRFQAADGTLLCDGSFNAVGTHRVGVGSWVTDPEAHPPGEIPVSVFESIGESNRCDEEFQFVWFMGTGDHGHMRYARTLDEVVAPVPWWPTLRSNEMTVEEFEAIFSALVERLAGALPPVEE